VPKEPPSLAEHPPLGQDPKRSNLQATTTQARSFISGSPKNFLPELFSCTHSETPTLKKKKKKKKVKGLEILLF
jgi:hypothetical protein